VEAEKPAFEDEPGLSAEEKEDVWERAYAILFGNCGPRPKPPPGGLPIVPPRDSGNPASDTEIPGDSFQ
jgi:hypothetical protein